MSTRTVAESGGDTLYDDRFYQSQMDRSYRSAAFYVAIVGRLLKPASVVDVGCGRGTWLKAFGDAGGGRLMGIDGPWNSQDKLMDPSIPFHGTDLNNPVAPPGLEKFDLALSVEVAEHLREASAQGFVRFLTGLTDAVMFGAAFRLQGGTGHVNEQSNVYWARRFLAEGYQPFDLFRPELWGNEAIQPWYQQNTFLYVRQGSPAFDRLTAAGKEPLSNIAFMDCLHADIYIPKLVRMERKRLGKRLGRAVRRVFF